MNTTHTAPKQTHQRRVHGTHPGHAASMVLSAALTGGAATPDACPGVAGQVVNGETSCDAAIALYERGQWELAYERLERLADSGDALASKLALLMLRYGTSLYGMRFVATPRQVARWARQVLAAAKWS